MECGRVAQRIRQRRGQAWWPRVLFVAWLVVATVPAAADPPPGYYNPVDPTSATTLRSTLHEVIDDHRRFPYTSSTQTDTWDILEEADQDPEDAGRILVSRRA